jgi:prepilin-type N-terminal cleavage/methylation domain-containing protein
MNTKKGFTLIEILVAIGILVLMVFTVSSFQKNVITYNKYGGDVLQSAQDAQSILRTMVAELRASKPGSNGSYPLVQVATSSITFYSDIDDDGLQDQIRYFLSTTTLRKGVIKPTGTLLSYLLANEKISILGINIKNSTSTALFDYYNNTFTGTSSPLAQPVNISVVRLVKINLTIDADPNRSPLPRTYTSQAMLRNLKDNL